MAIKEIVKGICNITRCKYDVYTKEKIDEMTIIENKDLKDVLESGYFVLGEGVTDAYANGESIINLLPNKKLPLINTAYKTTANVFNNGTTESVDIYQVNQAMFLGSTIYYRNFQLLQSNLSVREGSMQSWEYEPLNTVFSMWKNVATVNVTVGANSTETTFYPSDDWNYNNTFVLNKKVVSEEVAQDLDSIKVKLSSNEISVTNESNNECEVTLLLLKF